MIKGMVSSIMKREAGLENRGSHLKSSFTSIFDLDVEISKNNLFWDPTVLVGL